MRTYFILFRCPEQSGDTLEIIHCNGKMHRRIAIACCSVDIRPMHHKWTNRIGTATVGRFMKDRTAVVVSVFQICPSLD